MIKKRLRRFEDQRREILAYDHAHINCQECLNHRVNHNSVMIKTIFFIGTGILATIIITLIFAPWISNILFLGFILYVFFSVLTFAYYSTPPHKRKLFKFMIERRIR